MLTGPATILGGLPIIADVSFGTDWMTGEGWSEVEAIYWRKRDGSKGKPIPDHLWDRAEKYDPYFADVTLAVSEHSAYGVDEPEDPHVLLLVS